MDFSTCCGAIRTVINQSRIDETTSISAREVLQVIQVPNQTPSIELLEKAIDELLYDSHWEAITAGFALLIEYVDHVTLTKMTEWFVHVHKHLEHREPRLRAVVARALGKMSEREGCKVYKEFQDQIIESIQTNMTRVASEDDSTEASAATPWAMTQVLDDTTGWKALETSLMALKEIMTGCGEQFVKQGHLTDNIVHLMLVDSIHHINRHVRAGGFDACNALCALASSSFLTSNGLDAKIVEALALGLQDNWSQVRFAASVATRTFLMKLNEPERDPHYQVLLPRMCLNRYYLAEGVKLYSQETWRQVFQDTGREMVSKYATAVAKYYIMVSDFDNHVVREAACHCIAELATKVDKDSVREFVPELLHALLLCFGDDSWPVRDAACVASGLFVIGFPEESRPQLETLFKLWITHLSDNIWSVREDAAVALGNVIRAYKDEALERVVAVVDDHMTKAKSQAAMTQQEYEQKLADEKSHTGNQVYSCGSLAPKLRKGGCSDCRFHREKELWEYTDGAIYMIRELCDVAPETAVKYMSSLADVAMLRHFPQTFLLQETLWKQLPAMADRLGKKVFKRHLELFFDPLVFTIKSHHRLAQHAAKECVRVLSTQIGPIIFRGRLEANPDWAEALLPYAVPSMI